MEYIVEFYHEGECLEQRTSNAPPWPDLGVGDDVYIEFENPYYSEEHGNWWRVTGRRLLLFRADSGVRTLQVSIEPAKSEPKARFGGYYPGMDEGT